MEHMQLFESFVFAIEEKKAEKKAKKWIQKAIKKPGALHKELGVPEGENIPMETINKKIDELHKKKESEDGLTKKESKTLRRLNLAKTLKTRIG